MVSSVIWAAAIAHNWRRSAAQHEVGGRVLHRCIIEVVGHGQRGVTNGG